MKESWWFCIVKKENFAFEGIKDGIQRMPSFYFKMTFFLDAVHNEFSFPMGCVVVVEGLLYTKDDLIRPYSNGLGGIEEIRVISPLCDASLYIAHFLISKPLNSLRWRKLLCSSIAADAIHESFLREYCWSRFANLQHFLFHATSPPFYVIYSEIQI